MKVHLIRKLAIGKYAEKNVDSMKGYQDWISIIKYADWEHPVDMLQTFGSAELLGNGSNRVAFDITKGHKLICKYVFGKSGIWLFVYWMGTRAEYATLAGNRKRYTVCNFETGDQNSISFKIIKNAKQYDCFCGKLEALLMLKKKNRDQFDEIGMLTVLIENHDCAHDICDNADPVQIIKSLVEENKDRPPNIGKVFGTNNGLVIDLVNYRRGLTKELVRKLAERFKMREDAFNRPYNIFSGTAGKVKRALVN
jgi:mRNA-degrading endonuclease HigB of HigAB toxin-antitoxin module/antitoxin component HigA of HigAB toxin-antitoxin module